MQLINKTNGNCFEVEDENLFEVSTVGVRNSDTMTRINKFLFSK